MISSMMPARLGVEGAWKNPKQRELKAKGTPTSRSQRVNGAWKNPKQRELKGRFAMTKMFCVSTLKVFKGCYISN